MIKKGGACLVIVLIMLYPLLVKGQSGGRHLFQSLQLPGYASLAGTGGVNVSSMDQDPFWLLSNPALMDSSSSTMGGFGYLSFPGQINYNSMAYQQAVGAGQFVGGGLQFLHYGEIDSYDDSGNYLGTFYASDFHVSMAYAHHYGPFSMGATAKFAMANLASWRATALLMDLGGTFRHPEKDLQVGLVFKNLGILLSDFYEGEQGSLPLDVQVGLSFKPEFMPLRFNFTAYQLVNRNITYFDPNNEVLPNIGEPGWVDRAMRRMALGVELLMHKNFHGRLGYNHLLRREMALRNQVGTSGLSLGFLVRVKYFEFSYTFASYHVAGGANYVSLATRMDKIFK